jgi:hypothetical protein
VVVSVPVVYFLSALPPQADKKMIERKVMMSFIKLVCGDLLKDNK